MLSPQLAALLQMWWREGERRNVMLPAPDARRSGSILRFRCRSSQNCGLDAGPQARDCRAKPTRLGRIHRMRDHGSTSEGEGGARDIAAADLQM